MQTNISAAAERNKQPILDELMTLLPPKGRALEIASGTGQHMMHFAAALPGLLFQPTEADESSLRDIAALREECGFANVRVPRRLDVLDAEWGLTREFDAVICINMIHISPPEATPALIAGARRLLKTEGPGLLVLYGPFREGGVHTAPSNAEFDAWLKEKDPRYGVRDLDEVTDLAKQSGFTLKRMARLPANNLLVAFAA